jgi:hypothetical protein
MPWDQKRKRDHNIMFAVKYEDGSTAYITVSPSLLVTGDHMLPQIARERQEKGEIPVGKIVGLQRVR